MHESEKSKWSRSVLSDSSWPHGLQPTRLLCPWDFPGKSTGVGCRCLLWKPPLVYPICIQQVLPEKPVHTPAISLLITCRHWWFIQTVALLDTKSFLLLITCAPHASHSGSLSSTASILMSHKLKPDSLPYCLYQLQMGKSHGSPQEWYRGLSPG